jgi:hypothetical protein
MGVTRFRKHFRTVIAAAAAAAAAAVTAVTAVAATTAVNTAAASTCTDSSTVGEQRADMLDYEDTTTRECAGRRGK